MSLDLHCLDLSTQIQKVTIGTLAIMAVSEHSVDDSLFTILSGNKFKLIYCIRHVVE